MFTSVLETIGNTPLVRVSNIDTGCCELYLKLENRNPGGSIKDRIGMTMIQAAEESGDLKAGGTIIEATAGNTGIALALVARQKGYKAIVVVPDKMSKEKIAHLRALGAQVVLTRSDVQKGHPEYYHDVAQRIATETPNSFYIDQFNNPNNPRAHEELTAPEIWSQMNGQVDAVVCGLGSGGTVTGLSRFFRRVAPHVEVVIADPVGSIVAHYVHTGEIGEAGSWFVEGCGEDYIPSICDLEGIRTAYSVPDKESFLAARELLLEEGLLGGSSTGLLVAAALRYCREQKERKRVVTFVCDSGDKYLSKVYNDYWMKDQGFLPEESKGDLCDLISRKFSDGVVLTAFPDETLAEAYKRMKLHDISQLPVLDSGRVVGIIDEFDMMSALDEGEGNFLAPVKDVMVQEVKVLSPAAKVEEARALLKEGLVVIVQDDEKFYGLITRTDYISFIRSKLRDTQ